MNSYLIFILYIYTICKDYKHSLCWVVCWLSVDLSQLLVVLWCNHNGQVTITENPIISYYRGNICLGLWGKSLKSDDKNPCQIKPTHTITEDWSVQATLVTLCGWICFLEWSNHDWVQLALHTGPLYVQLTEPNHGLTTPGNLSNQPE